MFLTPAHLFVYFQKKTSAEKVSDLLKKANGGRASILMSAHQLWEFYGITLQGYGRDRALAVMTATRALPLQFTDATPGRAVHAADVKTTYSLHYADRFAAAVTIEHKATLVTSDSDFKKRGHGFPVLWLKN